MGNQGFGCSLTKITSYSKRLTDCVTCIHIKMAFFGFL